MYYQEQDMTYASIVTKLTFALITFISFTSAVMSVWNPRRTWSEYSKSSVFPIFAWNNNLFCSGLAINAMKSYYRWMLTSHLGDSGTKNNPGIRIVQGKMPYICKSNRKKLGKLFV